VATASIRNAREGAVRPLVAVLALVEKETR
jgi:hypothetical protein